MKPIDLTKDLFSKKIIDINGDTSNWNYLGDKPAIIDFYASWCGPCKALAPVLDELAAEYADKIYTYKIDTEKEQELSEMFAIRSIPSLLFIPSNEKPYMIQGALPKKSMKEEIEKLLIKK